jgi:hypothetical protein
LVVRIFGIAKNALMKTIRWVRFASIVLLLLAWARPAQAERDIVYAARYYAPPGSHNTSHFHLYRINPDGTGRTQLTFGNTDECAPHWSPDGHWIAFIRLTTLAKDKYGSVRHGGTLCLLAATGVSAKQLIDLGPDDLYGWGSPVWSPDSRTVGIDRQQTLKAETANGVYLIDIQKAHIKHLSGMSHLSWSPDGRWMLMATDKNYQIRNTATGTQKTLTTALESVKWIAPALLVGIERDAKTKLPSVCVFDARGQETQRIILRFEAAYAYLGTGGGDPLERSADLLAIPSQVQTLVYALSNSNSTVGVDYLFLIMPPNNGALSYLIEGQFLAWSPDGTFFCSAPGRDKTPYEKRPLADEGGPLAEGRTVWTAPLYVRAIKNGPMRQLTPRLSLVTGADWRRGGHNAAKR